MGGDAVTWLATAPAAGAAAHPVALDLAESLISVKANHPDRRLADHVVAVLAPRWEDLHHPGDRDGQGLPMWGMDDPGSASVAQQTVVGALCRSLAMLGPDFGVVVRDPEHVDEDSVLVVRRLLREARRTGFRVALAGDRQTIRRRYGGEAAPQVVASDHGQDPVPEPLRPFLAVSPAGITEVEAERLLATRVQGTGPTTAEGGRRRFCLSSEERVLLQSRVPLRERRRLHRLLFEAIDPAGWGYLRRSYHAIHSGDRDLLVGHLSAHMAGLEVIGFEFQARYLDAVLAGSRSLPEDILVPVLISAGRLAAHARPRVRPERAVSLFTQALKRTPPGAARVELIYEIANTHAKQRTPAGLARSRGWYERGFSELAGVAKPDRASAEIRLLNGLALVEYLEGHDEAALALERRALAIAASDHGEPDLASWARPLLHTNMAKVLATRLVDPDAAGTLLALNLDSAEERVRESATVDLARLRFDRQDFSGVVELLAPMLEGATVKYQDEESEAVARAMLAIAHLATGRPHQARRQVDRLHYLCEVLGVDDRARGLLGCLEAQLGLGATSPTLSAFA